MIDSHKMWCEVCRKYVKSNKKEQHFNKHLDQIQIELENKNKRKVCRKRVEGYRPIHQGKCNHNRTRLQQSRTGWEIKCFNCGEIIEEGNF